MDEERVPRVFISYSHDTPEHKRWVTTLSSKLMSNGIDVILDQWDLGLGDDVPKFMEKAVTDADRVLMICTETYVRKADDGKGGVGYEAMVVTGELINNLGTSKFIPVIRQKNEPIQLPRALSTRFYINLSQDDKFDDEFDSLLRELHKVPAVVKPQLGVNPFALTPSGEELPEKTPKLIISAFENDEPPENIYRKALEIARNGDLLSWKDIARKAKSLSVTRLVNWRASIEGQIPKKENLVNNTLAGVESFFPLITVALAGIASGRAKFANQLSLFEELLYPRDWNRAGYNVIVELPETAAFVYQALHGALCLHTDQLNVAIKFIRNNFEFYNMREPLPIWEHHGVMGWPRSLGGISTDAWKALFALPDHFPFIASIFGDKEEYQTALVAYYMALNVNEYSYVLIKNQVEHLEKGGLSLDIPLCFLSAGDEIKRRAYRLLLQDPEQVKAIWESLNISNAKLVKHWNAWLKLCSHWQSQVYPYAFSERIIHSRLLNDLGIH